MATEPTVPARRSSQKVRNVGIGCGVLLLLCIGLAALGAALGGSGSGGGSSTTVKSGSGAPAPTATPPPKVGDTITSGNWEYIVTKVEKAKSLESGFGPAQAKGEFLVVYLTLKNIGKENFSINTFDFEAVDKDGVKYNETSDFTVSGWKTKNGLTGLGQQFIPGLTQNTALVFDINPAATGFKLNLKQARNTMIDLGV